MFNLLRVLRTDESEVLRIQEDYRQANLDPATKQLLDFAAKLTSSPREARSVTAGWRMLSSESVGSETGREVV